MITLTYENTEGAALYTALMGLEGLWATVTGDEAGHRTVTEVRITGVSANGDLLGRVLTKDGDETGVAYREPIDSIISIAV